MGLLRFMVWTALSVAFGIFLATFELNGKTPWRMAQSMWRDSAPKVERVKDDAGELVDGMKKKVTASATLSPKETHTADDRKAIDALIAKKTATP